MKRYEDYLLGKESVKNFFYWMNERHRIFLKRQADKPWPWTEDDILREFKFTNAYRELDTGTVWLREYFRKPYAAHHMLFFNIAAYRQFNWWPTFRQIGYIEKWNADYYDAALREYRDAGNKIFTGAHLTTGTLPGRDKIEQYIRHVLDPLHEKLSYYTPTKEDTLESAFRRLRGATGFGPFISFEIITDLRWTRYLEHASDILTWANPGPGAMRGINRMIGLPVGKMPEKRETKDGKLVTVHYPVSYFNETDYVIYMQELLDLSDDYLEDHMPPIEMREIEHSLCEWDKYQRVKTGQGKVRSRFTSPDRRSAIDGIDAFYGANVSVVPEHLRLNME